ncbi:S8 family serine peptidase [Nocardia sp. NRRL S-836]|uniref:S8 family serine peptidase n=1 Tax=Nocardia sp. NRRL S-836 TaxID=1519492 RepID=UPI0006B0595C|nr:S8 family serine peptidase [Nocardia sp. NRRL S-836]KOV79693.1 hypothetical protein ADL03_36155 [Nocardia sp. NRRL S-836]
MTTLLVAGLLGPATAAHAEPEGTAAPQHTSTITLITGDRVVVDDRGALVRVDGRPGMSFARYVKDDHQYVVPADAADALRQNRVDQRFFDVTALHEFGYTDDRADSIPVLGQGLRAATAVSKEDAAVRWGQRAAARDAGKLWLDGKSKLALDQSVPMVGAPGAWQAGFDGTGVTVAVLDSGYDQQHPELKDAVAVAKDFTPSGIQDDVGHGTHVAATVAGRSAKYSGVARGAKLAIGRVCATEYCQDSAIIAGMEWAAREVRAKVVNLSLGGAATDGTDPLSQKVNELTAETGALFVVAAGNNGDRRKVSAPAAADAALAVANLTKSGVVNETSSRGPRQDDFAVKPDIAAPGTDIVAARAAGTLPGNTVDGLHARLTGTSMASPHVAGAAAILAQRNPTWTAAELKAHLMATVKPVDDTPANVGTGLLDVDRAVKQPVRADTGSLSFGLVAFPHTGTLTRTITYHNAGDEPVSLALHHDLGADFTVPASVVVPARGSAPVEVVLDPRKGLGTFFGHIRATGTGVALTTAVGAYVQEERHTLLVRVTGRDGKPDNDPVVLVNMTTQESSLLFPDADGRGSARLPVADYAVLARISQHTTNYAWYTPVSATEVAGRVSLASDVALDIDARQGREVTVGLPGRNVVWNRDTELKVPVRAGRTTSVTGRIDGRTPLYSLPVGAPLPELTYSSALQGGQPRVSVAEGFPLNYFEDSGPLPAGEHTYDVAERGADVRGKLALVRQAGEVPLDVARAMQTEGAVAVLWAGPVPFGSGEPTAIPVIAVPEHHVAVTPARLALRVVASSPVAYNLFKQDKGALPAGTWQVRHSELAEVKARYHSAGADGFVTARNYPSVNGVVPFNFGTLDERVAAPVERTEYYSAGNGIGWFQEGFGAGTSWAALEPVVYAPGRRYERSHQKAVHSPRFGRPSVVSWSQGGGVDRAGDTITMRMSPFGGTGWVENWKLSGYGTVDLLRDGVAVGWADIRQGQFTAPERTGTYELVLDAVRHNAELSTRVRTNWKFSAATDGRLPLLEVDYALPVDLRNSWQAGVPMPARFTAARQAGAGQAAIRELKAYASFDDGTTWAPVKSLVPAGPAGGFVSLRVVAADTEGNSVDQTVLRAYRLKA